jgi:hypothetical protein
MAGFGLLMSIHTHKPSWHHQQKTHYFTTKSNAYINIPHS